MVAETLASRAGGRLAIVVGDVGAKGGPAQIAAEAAAALGGRIDILVNNAGGAKAIAGEADDAYWEESSSRRSSTKRSKRLEKGSDCTHCPLCGGHKRETYSTTQVARFRFGTERITCCKMLTSRALP